MINKIILFIGLVLVFVFALSFDVSDPLTKGYDLKNIECYLKSGDGLGLLFETNELFMAAGECAGCHGFDGLEIASVDENGFDINVIDDWRSSMMANSAKDPFWKAKVNHESLVYPQHQTEIETSCTDCHAPLGYFNAIHIGLDTYTMADLEADSIAKDGVSCAACHQLIPDSVGKHFSGELYYQEQNLYGPYENPFGGPMESFVGFTPVYDEYVTKSEACAGCHSLETETIDLDGNITGNKYYEQATYHEWLNSAYNVDDKSSIQCQGCHMPVVNEDVIIAANLLFLPPRSPFFEHEFAGANVFMLKLLKDNIDTLEIRANSAQMDSTIAHTLTMLQENTLDLDLVEIARDDSTEVEVTIVNKAGHKFPSGYPSRLAFVELLAINLETGEDTIFASGLLDGDYNIVNRDDEYEPHFDFINSEEDVQIYENVFSDATGNATTILTQAQASLKDNRMTPFGFTTLHTAYDTTLIVGLAETDVNFNKDESGAQGTGSDKIRYKFYTGDPTTPIQITAKVYYQSVPPKWVESMFEYSSDQIDHFQEMYLAADHTPVMMVADTLISEFVDGVEEVVEDELTLLLYPNPSKDGRVAIQSTTGKSIESIVIYEASGKMVESINGLRHNYFDVQLPRAQGYYFITIFIDGRQEVHRILRL
ncbi:MAG: hypothetical protein ACI8XB_000946 [Patiriisocius sp.]|jgi:hypothetical protein